MRKNRPLVRLSDVEGEGTIPLWPDTADILGCGRNAIYKAAREGTVPTIRIGRSIRVPVPALRAMLEQRAS